MPIRRSPRSGGSSLARKDLLHEEDLGDVRLVFDGYWVRLFSRTTAPYPITGKYMFFSRDSEKLRRIALAEIRAHGFHVAKYNPSPLGRNTDSVLCLYYRDESRKYELAKRASAYHVKYRYWKSNEATRAGRYSNEFLRGLSPEKRAAFVDRNQEEQDAPTSAVGRPRGKARPRGRKRE